MKSRDHNTLAAASTPYTLGREESRGIVTREGFRHSCNKSEWNVLMGKIVRADTKLITNTIKSLITINHTYSDVGHLKLCVQLCPSAKIYCSFSISAT